VVPPVAVTACVRCREPSGSWLCEACLGYLWLHEPLRFDARIAEAPGIQADLLRGAVAVMSSDDGEPLEFCDGRPLESPAAILRHLPAEGGSLLVSAGDREAIHRTLLASIRDPPRRPAERNAWLALHAHLANTPHLPPGVREAMDTLWSPGAVKAATPPKPKTEALSPARTPKPKAPATRKAPTSRTPPLPALPKAPPEKLPRSPAQVMAVREPAGPHVTITPAGPHIPAKIAPPSAPAPEAPPAEDADRLPSPEVRAQLDAATESHLEDADYAGALGALEAHLGAYPADTNGWYERAEILVVLNRPEDALASYDRCLEADPAHIGALAERASLLMSMGRLEPALQAYRTLIERDRSRIPDFLARAEDFRMKKNFADAVLLYNVILEVESHHVRASIGLGQALLALGDPEAADAAFTRGADANPENPDALFWKGQMLLKQGRWGGAIQFFNRAVAQQWNHTDAWVAKAEVLVKLAKATEALEAIDKVLRYARNRTDAWTLKAQAHLHLGELESALLCYEEVLGMEPGNEIAKLGRETLNREIAEKRRREASLAQH